MFFTVSELLLFVY